VNIPAGATSGPLLVSVAPSMDDSNAVRFTVTSQALPNTWLDQDIGSVGLVGSATYANDVFTVKGAGPAMRSISFISNCRVTVRSWRAWSVGRSVRRKKG
jgi:hypothetical protein